MNISSRSLAATLIVIIVVAVGYFVVRPKYSDYVVAKAKIEVAQQQQDSLKVAQQQLNDFLTQYKANKQTADLLNLALPLTRPEMENILNNLDTITKGSGLSLGQIAIVETPGSDLLGAVPHAIQPVDLNITATGSFDSFKNFLAKIESNLRIMDIGSVSIGSASVDTSGQSFNMSVRTYYEQ